MLLIVTIYMMRLPFLYTLL